MPTRTSFAALLVLADLMVVLPAFAAADTPNCPPPGGRPAATRATPKAACPATTLAASATSVQSSTPAGAQGGGTPRHSTRRVVDQKRDNWRRQEGLTPVQ